MKDFLDKLLSEIPRYMGDVTRCLVNPKAFFQEQLSGKSDREIIEKGITFFILSSIVVFVLTKILPAANLEKFSGDTGELVKLVEDSNQFIQFGTDIIAGCFELLAAAAIIYLSWRLARAKPNFQQCFGLAAFLLSILVVVNVFIQATPNMARLDPAVGRNLAVIEKDAKQMLPLLQVALCKADPTTGTLPQSDSSPEAAQFSKVLGQLQARQSIIAGRPIYQLTQAVQVVLRTALFLWLLAAWWAFARIQAVPAHAAVLSFIPAAGGLLLLSVVTGAMEASDYARHLYANC